MKRYLLLLAVTFLVSASFGQKEKEESAKQEKKEAKRVIVPAPVKSSFEKSYPSSSGVKWEKEGGDYEVNFTQNGQKMSAVYDIKGMLKETETSIKVSELPASVTDYVKQHYKGASIKGAAKITKTTGETMWEAELNKKALIFDSNGKFVKQEKD